MRVELKGIHTTTVKLRDGSYRRYYYLGKNGPRLQGEPGSPEFHASYNEAAARKVIPPKGTLLSVLNAYRRSDEFRDLAPRTRWTTWPRLRLSKKSSAPFHWRRSQTSGPAACSRRGGKSSAVSSRRQADYAWVVLARVLSFGLDNELVAANPCSRGGRLYRGSGARGHALERRR